MTALVALCGSMRFSEAMKSAAEAETLAGRIVLTPIACPRADREALAVLHRQRIDLADEVLVVNPGGYTGVSVSDEIAHALHVGKPVRFTESRGEKCLNPPCHGGKRCGNCRG